MDVGQAEAFTVLAEELHFGRAAERLNIAQPPLSRMIKNLERSMRAKLFERSTRHVELTVAGAALVEPALKIIEASKQAKLVVENTVSGNIGRVQFGFAGASIHRSVGRIAQELRRRHPGLDVEFHSSQFSHQGLEKVLDGSLDIVIGRWDFIPTEIDSSVVGIEQAILALPASHPLADRKLLSINELAYEQWVVLPGGFGAALQSRLDTLAMQAGFAPQIAQTAPDSWTLTVLVGAGIGCALTLDTVRDNVSTAGVRYIPLKEGYTELEVRLIWRRNNKNPALKAAVETIQALLPDPRKIKETS